MLRPGAGWCRARFGRPHREVHDVTPICPIHREGAARRVEDHLLASRLQLRSMTAAALAGGAMTTKRHLDDGREPAQSIVAAFRGTTVPSRPGCSRRRVACSVASSRKRSIRYHRGGISCETGEVVKASIWNIWRAHKTSC